MAYASASDVAAFCPNLLTGASNFSASTLPTVTQVEGWLDRGSAAIDNTLNSRGFTPPTSASSNTWGILQELDTWYGVAMAEMARTNTRLAPGERTRGQQFMQMWKDGLKDLTTSDITGGDPGSATYTHRGYVGGISESEKETVTSNGDRIPMRVSRGMFDNPKTPVKGEGNGTPQNNPVTSGGVR